MRGYDGVETLVYRAIARVSDCVYEPVSLVNVFKQIMEQVEGGDLIVNRGEESRPRDTSSDSPRDMNAVEGYDAACKLAQVQTTL